MARILVVDDSRFQRVALEAFLKQAGHETVLAENGAVGLALVVSEKPDAILVDLEMPVLDGFAFLAGLRDLQVEVPAAVITGDTESGARERCIELGAADFLRKPISNDELRQTLATLLPEAGAD
jgi:twitching motility two-component system response regulator PilH